VDLVNLAFPFTSSGEVHMRKFTAIAKAIAKDARKQSRKMPEYS